MVTFYDILVGTTVTKYIQLEMIKSFHNLIMYMTFCKKILSALDEKDGKLRNGDISLSKINIGAFSLTLYLHAN